MVYYADPQQDLPAPWKTKRLIFYAMGLKVYGQMPYILQKKLKSTFISNHTGAIWWPAAENNYTLVPYRRPDGSQHNQAVLEAFFNWLYDDKGFEFAVASEKNFYDDIRHIDIWEWPPELRPANENDRQLIAGLIELEGRKE